MKRSWSFKYLLLLLLFLALSFLAACGGADTPEDTKITAVTAGTLSAGADQSANGEADVDGIGQTSGAQGEQPSDAAKPGEENAAPSKNTGDNSKTTAGKATATASGSTAAAQKHCQVLISRNFGRDIIKNENLPFSGETSVMALMQDNFQVELAYGGSFINAIDGLKSGYTGEEQKEKKDWIYYLNGIAGEVGAADTMLADGNMLQWDYRDWSVSQTVGAMAGAYPRIFTCEDSALTIQYTPVFKETADKLQEALDSLGKTAVVEEFGSESLQDKKSSTIVIGLWDDLSADDYVYGYYKNYKRTGLFFGIDTSGVILRNEKQADALTLTSGSVIAAVQKQTGCRGVLFLVTGNDESMVTAAVSLLLNQSASLAGCTAVAWDGQSLYHLPRP